MKIVIDIGHPAHVHYFKNIYKIMSKKHSVYVFARDKFLIKYLLKKYNIDFQIRSAGKDNLIGKISSMMKINWDLYKRIKKIKPNIALSFSSPYLAQVSFLQKIPHISLGDTEHANFVHKIFTYPFSKTIITPKSYQKENGKKHIKIDCLIENLYLNDEYFKPNRAIIKKLGLNDKKYVLIRIVSWKAFHDVNQNGIKTENLIKIIKLLENYYKVYISSEDNLPHSLIKYKLDVPYEEIHNILAFSEFFLSESGTMASESAILGTPVVYVNSLPLMGYLKYEEESGVLKHFNNDSGLYKYLEKNISQLKRDNVNKINQEMMVNFINPTIFLIWFIENYPISFKKIKENPQIQYNFR